jgi:signal peptidase II
MDKTDRSIHQRAPIYLLLVTCAVVLLDRLTKWMITRSIPLDHGVIVIPGFLQLTHSHNVGAAFDLLRDSTAPWKLQVLIGISVVTVIAISALLWKTSGALNRTTISLSFVLAGAAGNLWDRLFAGYVVDFVDLSFAGYHWPAFNVADSAIVIGAGLMLFESIVSRSNSAINPFRH